ncbi:uncharacterized protein [Diabrotica undecimpunctata]|uniref:uncharacterized protein n=1 Tax=Diabrotica undecimpunctata TaxID=50387 RepID=UPI003B63E8AB
MVRKKKEARKKYDRSKNKEDKDIYKVAKKGAKRAVVSAKERSSAQLYEELETLEKMKRVLRTDGEIKRRSHEYFRKLLNEERERRNRGCGIPNENVIPEIAKDEVIEALNRMKIEKVRKGAPWSTLFADDIMLVEENKEILEKLECWRRAIEEGELKVSRLKTEYMWLRGRRMVVDIELLGEKLSDS